MEFLKNHYEKILLSIVLLGLAVAAALLPMKVAEITREVDDPLIPPPPIEWEGVEETEYETTVKRVEEPNRLDLSMPNHLVVNPVTWLRKPSGQLIAQKNADSIGAGAMQIVKIQPLRLQVEFAGAVTSGQRLRYEFMITQEDASTASQRRPKSQILEPGFKNDIFLFKGVIGSEDNPQGVILDLDNGNKTITVMKGEPFTRVVGYRADLIYPPEDRKFEDRFVGDNLRFNKEVYTIVSITEQEVVLEKPNPASEKLPGERIVIQWKSDAP